MSNSDFEDRLTRIKANAGQAATPPAGGSAGTGFPYLRIFLGAGLIVCGVYLVRFANTEYETIRDQYGIAAAAGLGLAGVALTLVGAAVKLRAIFRFGSKVTSANSITAYPISKLKPQAQTSGLARFIFSVLGLGLGALACLVMFIGNAATQPAFAGQIDPKTARALFVGMVILAGLMGAVSLVIGGIGLFVRGLPMRRVPIFFLLGVMLVFSSFQSFRIHPVNWPTFMTEVISLFKDRMEGQNLGESTL